MEHPVQRKCSLVIGLCDVMKRPELKADQRFLEIRDRVKNHEDMFKEISAWTEKYKIDEIVKALNDAGCPSSPVNTLDRVATEPQIAQYRGMFPEINQPGIGKLKITGAAQNGYNLGISGAWYSIAGSFYFIFLALKSFLPTKCHCITYLSMPPADPVMILFPLNDFVLRGKNAICSVMRNTQALYIVFFVAQKES